MARPRLFSFFNRAPDASSFLAPPVAVSGIKSEPPVATGNVRVDLPEASGNLVDILTAKVASVTAERDQAQAACTASLGQCAELESAIVALKATLGGLTTERDTLKAEAARTREDITQELRNQELATLAASQGIPAGTEIVPANHQREDTREDKIAALSQKLAECKSPTDRFELAKQARALSKE